MEDNNWIDFVLETHEPDPPLPDGHYMGLCHHVGDPPGGRTMILRKANGQWTHESGLRLEDSEKILRVRRVGNLPG